MSFLGFLKRRQQADRAPERLPCIPDGRRVYAIGDIHGRDDLFAQLLRKIEADNASRETAQVTLILLGDLVDRGPDSAAVIERAIAIGAPFDTVHLLVGNHEECFLAALTGDEKRVRYFARIGGDATIKSYWRDDASYMASSFAEVTQALPKIVPQAHVDFLSRGEDMIRIGDYAFVHAGVRPGVDLDRQKLADLRWIRDEFLRSEGDFGAVIVHGHTISETVERTGNRIGIDTGAYCTGNLTALGLEGEAQWEIQAHC